MVSAHLTPVASFDTGSAHAGGCVIVRTPRGAFPFVLLGRPSRPAVDPLDLAPAVTALWSAHVESLLGEGIRVVIEGGNPYGRGGVIVSAAAVALQHAARLGDRLHVLCEAAGVPVRHVVAATWRSYVVPRELRGQGVDKRGRARTFIQDRHVALSLPLYLSPLDVAALASRDERDAAGAAIGVVLAEEEAERDAAKARERAARVPVPRAPRERVERAPAKSKGRGSLADRVRASRERSARLAAAPAKPKASGLTTCRGCFGTRGRHHPPCVGIEIEGPTPCAS